VGRSGNAGFAREGTAFDKEISQSGFLAGYSPAAAGILTMLASPGDGGMVSTSTGAALVALGTAILSNALNNLPLALIVAAAFRQIDPLDALRLVAGAIVGIDLGPNLTTVGAFSMMLWVMLLRRRGLDVSAAAYARVGLLLTLPALLAAMLALILVG
jgi:arsenical pump membrane protein